MVTQEVDKMQMTNSSQTDNGIGDKTLSATFVQPTDYNNKVAWGDKYHSTVSIRVVTFPW
jgi:hypothetical protein